MRQKSISVAIFVSAFVASYSLFYLTGDRVTYSRGIDAAINPDAFGSATSTPVAYLDISQQLNAEIDRLTANMTATAVAAPQDSTREESVAELALPTQDAPAREQTVVVASLETPATPAIQVAPPAPLTVLPRTEEHASLEAPAVTPNQAQSLDPKVDRVSFNTPTLAPMAFMRFCLRYADDCKIRDTSTDVVSLTDARRAELVRVNRAVNRSITPQANLGGVMAEEWLINPPEGDCNDYAVTKRHELLALGWPSRALLLAEVIVPSGEHHLVLVVHGQEDDLVLDSLNWNIRSVGQIRYQWVRVQQANNPKFWSVASVSHPPRVAMNARQGPRS